MRSDTLKKWQKARDEEIAETAWQKRKYAGKEERGKELDALSRARVVFVCYVEQRSGIADFVSARLFQTYATSLCKLPLPCGRRPGPASHFERSSQIHPILLHTKIYIVEHVCLKAANISLGLPDTGILTTPLSRVSFFRCAISIHLRNFLSMKDLRVYSLFWRNYRQSARLCHPQHLSAFLGAPCYLRYKWASIFQLFPSILRPC
ncbi:hypothetical protein FB446DRAFT_142365 [Lentinula raphanica]|nr:hypothetical protein FB446DRAFT_142365 [Lentinula raphanica]